MENASQNNDLVDFWEGRWQSGKTPWDHGRFAPPFEEFVDREQAPSGSLLIPGPGSGHDVRFFAEGGADVTGLDIAPSAIKVAEQLNPHQRARYILGNILDPDESLLGRFDWIIEHTCLCAMDPSLWEAYARSIPRLLKPSGQFLALFYRNPHDDEGPPFGISAEVIGNLFDARFTLIKSWVPKKSYESRAGREELRWYRLRD